MTGNITKNETESKTISSIQSNINALHELFKKIIDSSCKRIIIFSGNKIVYANNKALSELGYNRKEFSRIALNHVFLSSQEDDHLIMHLGVEANLKDKSTDMEPLRVARRNGDMKKYKPRILKCFWMGNPSILMVLNDVNVSTLPHTTDLNTPTKHDITVHTPSLFNWDYKIGTGEFHLDKKFFDYLNLKPRSNDYRIEDWFGPMTTETKKRFNTLLTNIRINKQQQLQWEYEVVDKSNVLHSVLANFEVVGWDTHGNADHIVGLHSFIDAKAEKTQNTNGQSSTLKGFIENAIDGLLVIDKNGVVQEWNPAMEDLTLIKREQAVGNYLWVLQHNLSPLHRPMGDFINDLSGLLSKSMQKDCNSLKGKIFESTICLTSGATKVVQHSIFTIDSPSGVLVAISNHDITGRRLAQSKVEKSEERLKLALAASNMGIWDLDMVTGERYFSPLVFAIMGYRPLEVELTTELIEKHIHPEDHAMVKQRMVALMATGSNLDLECRVLRKDGKIIWVHSKTRLIRDERNKLLRITGTIADITRQKDIETELRKNEEGLKRNIQQHEMVSSISLSLNTNKPFREKIEEILHMLGKFTQVSRVYIFENHPTQNITANTHEWCNEGVDSQKDNLKEVPVNVIEGWAAGKEILMSRNLSVDLPSELAEIMIRQEIESFLIFRLHVGGRVFGYIGFDECGYRRLWEKTEVELLKTIANLISYAFELELS